MNRAKVRDWLIIGWGVWGILVTLFGVHRRRQRSKAMAKAYRLMAGTEGDDA